MIPAFRARKATVPLPTMPALMVIAGELAARLEKPAKGGEGARQRRRFLSRSMTNFRSDGGEDGESTRGW
jgi:hypothetical protein